MKTTDWRGSYIAYDGYNTKHIATYVSITGSIPSGNGSRENPYSPIKCTLTNMGIRYIVIGNGQMDLDLLSADNTTPSIIGQSKESTILNSVSNWKGHYMRIMKLKDLTIKNNKSPHIATTNCILKDIILTEGNYDAQASITNSIFYGKPVVISYTAVMTNRCTFVRSPIFASIFKSSAPILVECEVYIDQTTLQSYANYMAFNNCKFIIGSEATANPLIGDNADELHANFVARCEAQGLTLKSANDDQTNTPVDRWIFSSTSIAGDYDVIENSEIHQFAKLRGIYLGYSEQVVTQIPITTVANIPASFTPATATHLGTEIKENSIGLLTTKDINKHAETYADSKIIWLGGLKKLSSLSLLHNLPTEAGVCPDSSYGLAKVDTKNIDAGKHYIIRSNNENLAVVKYNNVEYTSSLITRNNVFVGVKDISSFDNLHGNALVYQVLDLANHQTVQIRLIRELPTPKITSGNLQAGYWYFVEPTDLKDTTASVTYKGIVRPAFDSFLVDSDLSFTNPDPGRAHLRRCWKQDFDFDAESTDKSFWNDRQKPYYFDVVSNDLRCMLKDNSSASVELAKDDNAKYIGSGHTDFYNKVNGITGLPYPAYNLAGTYLQIRVPITTTNLM